MKRRQFLKGATASALLCACGEHDLAQAATKRYFCGFVDPPRPTGISIQSFNLDGAGRRNLPLTWNFTGTVAGVAQPAVLQLIQQAFGKWAAVAPKLAFSMVTGNANINFTVADLSALGDGVLGATNKPGTNIQISSRDTFVATAALNSAPNDLLSVLTHEIGHALGLAHSSSDNSIMRPDSINQETLGFDDIAGIRVLYGWDPQASVGFATDATPSICSCGNTLAMVWSGHGDDHNIWISTSTDGKSWTAQRKFSDVGTVGSPALVWDGTRLWMVWRGPGDDQGLYYKTSTDFFVRDNPKQQNIKGAASSTGPRIAIVSGTPTLVWKGIKDDRAIYYSQFKSQWQPQAKVNGVGTEASPAICQDFGGGARLLWRGVGDDHVLYTTRSGSSVSSWDPQSVLSWTIPSKNPNSAPTGGTAGSIVGPSLALESRVPAAGPPVIHAAWHGAKNNSQLWYSRLTNDTVNTKSVLQWSDQANVPGAGSSDGPSLALFKGALRMVWKGGQGDTRIWTTTVTTL